jgi:prepilin-type N-terminal cleavage/methylation domain-containing protein
MIKNKLFFRKFRLGFTLTEVLIVVIIIGILATLSLPMLVKTLEKAKLGEAASNLNLIRTGEKIYFLEYSTFTSDISKLNIENPNTDAKYFDYSILSGADAVNFTAKADRKDSNSSGEYKDNYYIIDKSGTITSYGNLTM